MGDLGTGLLGSCWRGRQVGKRAWLSAHMDGCGLKTVGPLMRRQGKLMLLSGQGDGLSGHFGLDKDANSKARCTEHLQTAAYGYLVVASAPYHERQGVPLHKHRASGSSPITSCHCQIVGPDSLGRGFTRRDGLLQREWLGSATSPGAAVGPPEFAVTRPKRGVCLLALDGDWAGACGRLAAMVMVVRNKAYCGKKGE
jgi:hypothetical protein